MPRYRIETFCRFTGRPQGVEFVDSAQEVLTFCVASWRSASGHVVYAIGEGRDAKCAIYVGGQNVTPHLKLT